ncbi:DUF72 domain-containing protein [Sphingosinicella sp. LHD-64]|uniref:DUF72 domain-containing protein n=1 Tax=Sphingosinicella sp. LHD-64 TaxID=3072139 RepID=UPI00280EF5F0|nr:DUF72 domain-containing protein [Sphingosinicella sp. LHD-64]MDQ8757890.1 DUF72 domain-containing protein [Sphingosinicella sp. LHD-64]
MAAGSIHIGIGGWDFDPWRGTFFPAGLAKTKQLAYVGEQLTGTEVNATYYSTQKPETFARWAQTVPDGFRFALKASRFCTNRRDLGEAGESIARFCGQGFTQLGDRLGPILWQFAPTKKFDPDEIRAFLALLPARQDGIALRHAIEPRNESFRNPGFVAMMRAAKVAIVFADHAEYPLIPDVAADFVYARFMQAREEEPTGYDAAGLDRWAATVRGWAAGRPVDGYDEVGDQPAPGGARDVFAFMINGAKVRAPAAAQALLARIS